MPSIYLSRFFISRYNRLDIEWKKEWFFHIPRVPKFHWESIDNRRKFMDEIATVLHIHHPSDWGKISHAQICELGVDSILNRYYDASLFKCLQSLYKGVVLSRICVIYYHRYFMAKKLVSKHSKVSLEFFAKLQKIHGWSCREIEDRESKRLGKNNDKACP